MAMVIFSSVLMAVVIADGLGLRPSSLNVLYEGTRGRYWILDTSGYY